jgi:two-component system LytT family response regulator
MIRTIIVEDERKGMLVIKELISQFAPDIEICGEASHTVEAIEEIESKSPDLVFMDVQLADGNGLDVLRNVSNRNFEIIFVTAYDHYAVQAFRLSAVDYLLKPIGIEEFQEAVEKVRRRLAQKSSDGKINGLLQQFARLQPIQKKITISTINGFELIEISDIIWCKSEGHYTSFFLTNKTRLTSSRNLGHYEELLVAHDFCRINHGTIINMQFAKTYMKGKGGYVIMQDGTELEISQRRKADFLARLGI